MRARWPVDPWLLVLVGVGGGATALVAGRYLERPVPVTAGAPPRDPLGCDAGGSGQLTLEVTYETPFGDLGPRRARIVWGHDADAIDPERVAAVLDGLRAAVDGPDGTGTCRMLGRTIASVDWRCRPSTGGTSYGSLRFETTACPPGFTAPAVRSRPWDIGALIQATGD
jgi:hypothetical protein